VNKIHPVITPRHKARLHWLLSLLHAWDDVPIVDMGPTYYTDQRDEFIDVHRYYSGKKWDDVDWTNVDSGFASIDLMQPSEMAYYVATYFSYGLCGILERTSQDHVNHGLSLLGGGFNACFRLANAKQLGTLLNREQCACIYEYLCWLAPLNRFLINSEVNRAKGLWHHRIFKPMKLERVPYDEGKFLQIQADFREILPPVIPARPADVVIAAIEEAFPDKILPDTGIVWMECNSKHADPRELKDISGRTWKSFSDQEMRFLPWYLTAEAITILLPAFMISGIRRSVGERPSRTRWSNYFEVGQLEMHSRFGSPQELSQKLTLAQIQAVQLFLDFAADRGDWRALEAIPEWQAIREAAESKV